MSEETAITIIENAEPFMWIAFAVTALHVVFYLARLITEKFPNFPNLNRG